MYFYFIELALLIAFLAAGAVQLIRVIPPVPSLIEKEVKPFACDLCMSFWLTLAAGVLAWFWWHPNEGPLAFALWAVAPAFIVCFWLVKATATPTIPPFDPDAGTDE